MESDDERLHLSLRLTVADEAAEATDDVVDQIRHNPNRYSSKCVQMAHDVCFGAAASMLRDLALSAFDGDDVALVHVATDAVMELLSLLMSNLSHPSRGYKLAAELGDDDGKSFHR